MINVVLGVIIVALIGWFAFSMKYVDKTGVIAAFLIGLIIITYNIYLFIILMIFFFSSSLLTKFKYEAKIKHDVAESPKGRNYKQVLGVGLVPITFILFKLLLPHQIISVRNFDVDLAVIGFLGALSTSTADTWAVEIGSLSNEKPRLITNPAKVVPKGVSGGVTILGEVTSLMGSMFISAIACIFVSYGVLNVGVSSSDIFWIISLSGFLGEKFDSIIGALLQAKYFCDKCKELTDKKIHKCGTRTRLVSGFKWCTNEVTNILASLIGSLLAILLTMLTQ